MARHVHKVAHALPGTRLEGHDVPRGLRPARAKLALRPADLCICYDNNDTHNNNNNINNNNNK